MDAICFRCSHKEDVSKIVWAFQKLQETTKTGNIILQIGMKCSKLSNVSQFSCIRFADRDMLMRYHWGLAVGHIYSHDHSYPSHSIPVTSDHIEPDDTGKVESHNVPDLRIDDSIEWDDDLGGPMDVEDLELGLEECDREPELEWESELDSNEDGSDDMSEISDEELELHSTYEIHY